MSAQPSASKAEARELWVSGWSMERIAARLGVSPETVSRWRFLGGWARPGETRPEGLLVPAGLSPSAPAPEPEPPPPAPPAQHVRPSRGSVSRLASALGVPHRAQAAHVLMLSRSRVVLVPTARGIQEVRVDVATYDKDTDTYADPLDPDTRLAAKRTVPDVESQLKGAQLLARITGVLGSAETEAAGTKEVARRKARLEVDTRRRADDASKAAAPTAIFMPVRAADKDGGADGCAT